MTEATEETAEPRPRLRHLLSNVDTAARTADCSRCGTNARIRVRESGTIECRGYATRNRSRNDPRNRKQRRDEKLRAKYGIKLIEYDALYREQDGRCGICTQAKPVLAVDHCHQTGKVRGLLCRECNIGIGLLGDEPDRVRAALAYLEMASG